MATRKIKKISVKNLDRKLLKLYTRLVCKRAHFRCELCKAKSTIQTHHVVGRRNMRLRYDLRNGLCLCARHHQFATDSVEQDGTTAYEYMVDYRPEDWDYLLTVKNTLRHWTQDERLALLKLFEHLDSKKEITKDDVGKVSSLCGLDPFA